jgi:rhodanese-related sulfurtransferase
MPPLEIDVAQLKAWRDAGQAFQLIDVREGWEHQTASVEGGINIPMSTVPARKAEIATDRPVVVMCHHGGRSMQVTRWLQANGFANAVNLAGGIDQWSVRIDPAVPRY